MFTHVTLMSIENSLVRAQLVPNMYVQYVVNSGFDITVVLRVFNLLLYYFYSVLSVLLPAAF
jgi:hypothetical protein